MARRGGFCVYCKRGLEASTSRGRLAFTWDHINPKKRGGGQTVPCCRFCNNLKADIHPKEWFWFIDNHREYWRHFDSHTQVKRVIIAEHIRRKANNEPPILRRYVPALTDGEFGFIHNKETSL